MAFYFENSHYDFRNCSKRERILLFLVYFIFFYFQNFFKLRLILSPKVMVNDVLDNNSETIALRNLD